MGKIALDTMQANEKALRASYRRSLENRLLETALSDLNVKHSQQKPIGERICYAAGSNKKKEKQGIPPWYFSLIAFIQQRQTSDSSQPAASIASRLPCLAHRNNIMDAKPYSLQPVHCYRQPSRNKEP